MQDESMGLSSNELLSQLESAEGIQEVKSIPTNALTEEQLLFGSVYEYSDGDENNSKSEEFELTLDEKYDIMVTSYENLIEGLKQDFSKKLVDLQSKPDTMSSVTNSRDHKHMLNCLRAIEKRLINKQYDKALIDTQLSIEDFESE